MSKLIEDNKMNRIISLIKEADATDKAYIDTYDTNQILLHCAEEMSECSSAINKYLRIIFNGPASSVSQHDAYANLKEELSDALSISYLLITKLNLGEEIAQCHLNKSKKFIHLLDNTSE